MCIRDRLIGFLLVRRSPGSIDKERRNVTSRNCDIKMSKKSELSYEWLCKEDSTGQEDILPPVLSGSKKMTKVDAKLT